MTEAAERVAVACPACSPDRETVHEVLSPGGRATVRCTDCGHVHKTRLPDERTVPVTVVVSQEGESFAARTDRRPDDRLSVGDEFVLDAEDAVLVVRVTDLELPDGRRTDAAEAGDVETVWTRAVGNVAVNATVHPAPGARAESRSTTLRVPGDFAFTVGERVEVGEEPFDVETVLLRESATGDGRGKLDREGETALAKDVKRVYGRAPGEAWSAW